MLSAIGLSVADDVKASIRKPTNIPAEALGPALQTLAKERGFQMPTSPTKWTPVALRARR